MGNRLRRGVLDGVDEERKAMRAFLRRTLRTANTAFSPDRFIAVQLVIEHVIKWLDKRSGK